MKKRILIIDDQEDIRQVAAISLEIVAGWDVSMASSGRDGLAKAASERPDAILLDVMMPGMDGPTTFIELQRQPETAGIPVIFLTANVRAVDRRRLAGIAVAAILGKPFDPTTLSSQIAGVLGWAN